VLGVVSADLRQAARPKNGYRLRQDNGGNGGVNFVAGTSTDTAGKQKAADSTSKGQVYYVEPSAFNYQGLRNQRNNNYDNFLRSNIDNEQDNRNFNNERGLDMQPFRTCESQAPLTFPYTGGGNTKCDPSSQSNANSNPILRVDPGEPKLTPLRWNNPHASEVEVNLWIMCADPPAIVPIKKPTCSGEGLQNNILEWAIPTDFNQMDWNDCEATKCFNGCNQPGDCMLQIYAHSVETRQYASATPIIISQQTTAGRTLPYSSVPLDAQENNAYVYPANFDLESMTLGKKAGNPAQQGKRNSGSVNAGNANTGNTNMAANLKVCVSSQRNGINAVGDVVEQVQLLDATSAYRTLSSSNVNLYICKRDEAEIQAEQNIEQVLFEVSSSTDGVNPYTEVGKRTENYSPYEFWSDNGFGGAGVKQVKVTIKPYSGAKIEKTVYLDLRGQARWRFRRHLKPVCPTGRLQEPCQDVRLDLSQLKRETCMSATDPNANFQTTTVQRAILHSDVANHAYQNSDYSPYMGQQACEISRTLQAASVIHMTSGNRGELGKNSIPNEVKQLVKTLNKKVNTIYQNYEKVANKVIDDLTKNGGKDTAPNVGPQAIANAFRTEVKGGTSAKRLKTTTYVPSFNTDGYNMNVIENAIAGKTKGNKAAYKDILTAPNPKTKQQYLMIYTSTMYRMLQDFDEAAKYGVTYQASIQRVPCKVYEETNPTLYQLSKLKGNNAQAADCCCNGPITNVQPGGCGATFMSKTEHKKRNAANKKDGGLYAARDFMVQHMRTLYNCPRECILNTENPNQNLAKALTKTSQGTCITYIGEGSVCVDAKTSSGGGGETDCRCCECIYNNADPELCQLGFPSGGSGNSGGTGALPTDESFADLQRRIRQGTQPERSGRVVKTGSDDEITKDDTAVCHTESTFTCSGNNQEFISEAQVLQQLANNQCTETLSTKIDDMCQDSPCDKDPDSNKCLAALDRCAYDPESGVMCDPTSENDPCENCICRFASDCSNSQYSNSQYSEYAVDGNNDSAYLALTSMIVLAAVL